MPQEEAIVSHTVAIGLRQKFIPFRKSLGRRDLCELRLWKEELKTGDSITKPLHCILRTRDQRFF